MKRISRIMLLVLALLILPSALADALPEELSEAVLAMLPEGAVVEETQHLGGMHVHTASIPDTGEVLLLMCSDGELLLVETQQRAAYDPSAPAVSRSLAEELARQQWPDCRILFSRDEQDGKLLGVAGENFCGSILVADGRIISRSLEIGVIFRDGRLTMDGALKVLSLHRPEAEFYALELDREDGMQIYEGEALLNGAEYEFELDVSSGKLLEWERD